MGPLIVTIVFFLIVAVVIGLITLPKQGNDKATKALRRQAAEDRAALISIRREASLHPGNPLGDIIVNLIDNHLNREIEQ